jgi:3-hydroxybutyryl-CoA dehydrogenase
MSKERIMVVGAGIMGAGIAQACVEAGYKTLLADVNIDLANKGFNNIKHFLQRKIEKGKIQQDQYETILSNLSVSGDFNDGADVDVVIEAVTENIAVKKDVFSKLDQICKPETILATNTSTISITMLGGATKRPEKVVGMHFFIPAPVMKLVEVTPGLRTSDETYEQIRNLSIGLRKTPVKAPDTSAFLVNRLLVPMWNEAMFLVMEGSKPEDIDLAMKLGGNLPMGPLELADFAGLDTVLSVMKEMYAKFGDPKYRPCSLMQKMVDGGMLGRKSGRGFYEYSK